MEIGYVPPECSASAAIEQGMHEYGTYLAKSKPPHEVDGLKTVIRRILHAQRIDSENLLLGMPLLGRVMAYHFHSDAPIWDTVARVTRECAMNNKLLDCDEGNVGVYTNPVPGAPRYVKFRKEPFTQDLFFEGVHPKTIPMVEAENFSTKEPEYLIPLIPSAFLFPDITIGLGFKTVICPIGVTELCELTKRFLDSRKGCLKVSDEFYKKNAKYFLPEFPTDAILRNHDDLLKAYKDGDFEHRVYIDGTMDVLPNGYILRTSAFDHKFHEIKKDILEIVRTRGSWLNEIYVDHQDNSGTEKKISAEFVVSIKRGANPFKYLENFKTLSRFSHSISPIRHYVGKGAKIYRRTPSDLFEIWYAEKSKSVAGTIKHKQADCIRELLALHAKCIACDHSEEIAKLIKEGKNKNTVLPILSSKYELTPYQALVVYNSPIHSFSEETKVEMKARIADQEKRAKELTTDITRVADIMYHDVTQFQKKYGKSFKRTRIPNYVGYVHIPKFDGIIQFSNISEALEILEQYNGLSGKIQFYSPSSFTKVLMVNNKMKKVDSSIPKHVMGSAIIEAPNKNCYTLCISEGAISCVKGIHMDSDNPKMESFIVTNEFMGIHRDGSMSKMVTSDMTMHKKLGRKGIKSDLVAIIPSTYSAAVVFHMNDAEPDVVRWDRVVFGQSTKMTNVPMGNMKILDIIPLVEGIRIISLDPTCTSGGFEYLYLDNLAEFTGTATFGKVALTRKTSRHKNHRKMAVL